ncbi:ABC transporter permease [Gorillibacterium massiliense]|uniref:ABC transporter permease n=1 Tax=Gorillibacterium massiliense TaxID=1280390 RepID=UPI00069437D4|nr:ABC transporter permease subunit [Gorillibacterium massiliense]
MMLPASIVLLINNYLPMLGVVIAFKRPDYGLGRFWFIKSPWSGFENFRFLFQNNVAWELIRNTVAYNAVFIIMNLVFGIIFAIMFNEMRNKLLAKFHQSAMFLPYILSFVVVGYLVYSFLGPEHGMLNTSLFPKLGWNPIDWYMEPKAWVYILPIVQLWKNIGYSTVIYLAAIIGIDNEYYEAATLDGATKRQQIFNITIPLIRPVIVVLLILSIGRIFYGDFGLFFQVTMNSGMLAPTTRVIDTYVYNTFLVMGDVGMSSAAGMFQAVVGFLLVLGSNMLIRKISREDALF